MARPVGEWHEIVDGVRRFADRWHRTATAAGWTEGQLYGLHDRAPYARLDAMGAAWIIACRRHQVLSVDRVTITIKTRSCATLQFYRVGAVIPGLFFRSEKGIYRK